MNPIFKDDHPLKSAVEKLESNHADFNAKDPKHGGKICEYFYEGIDWLEGKLNLYHLVLILTVAISKLSLIFFSRK